MANETDDINLDHLDDLEVSVPGQTSQAAERVDEMGGRISALKSRQTRKIGDDILTYENATPKQQQAIDSVIAKLDPSETVRIISMGSKEFDGLRDLNRRIAEDQYGKAITEAGMKIAEFIDRLESYMPEASEIHDALTGIDLETTDAQKADAVAREQESAAAKARAEAAAKQPQRRGLFERALGIGKGIITPGSNQRAAAQPEPVSGKEAFAARMQKIESNIQEGMKTLEEIKVALEKADGDLVANEQNIKASQAESFSLDKKLQIYFAALREFEYRLINGQPSVEPKYGPAGADIVKLGGDDKKKAVKAAFATVGIDDERGLRKGIDDMQTLHAQYMQDGSATAAKKLNEILDQLMDVVTAKADSVLEGITQVRQYQQTLSATLRANGAQMMNFQKSSREVDSIWTLTLVENKQVQIVRAGAQVTSQIQRTAIKFAENRLANMKAAGSTRITGMEARADKMRQLTNLNDAQDKVGAKVGNEVTKKFGDVGAEREKLLVSTSQMSTRSSEQNIAQIRDKIRVLRNLTNNRAEAAAQEQPTTDLSIPMPALPAAEPVPVAQPQAATRLLARAVPASDVTGKPLANDPAPARPKRAAGRGSSNPSEG